MTARFAPVVPLFTARWLQGDKIQDDILGSYHLLLAHDVLQYPKEYREVYGEVKSRYPDWRIILDNSVVELGDAMPIKELLEAAREINPTYLVIPDVMSDAEGTERVAKEFVKAFKSIYPDGELDAGFRLMGVVQGKHFSEIQNCIHFLSDLGVRHFGIPRTITRWQGTRSTTVLYAKQHPNLGSIHLLGFSDDILDDVACARIPGVAGIDSAVPIRAGLKGMTLTLNEARDYGKRGNYWNEASHRSNHVLYDNTVIDNICSFRRWIGESTGA